MASRESSIDEASRPLMSTADTEGQQPVRPSTPGFFTPPAGRYGGDEGEEKRWPLNVVLLCLFRVFIIVLALAAVIHILKKRSRDGGEGSEVVLIVVGIVQILWNLLKLTPRCFWRKALLCLGDDHEDRPVDCTVGAYRFVLMLAHADEDQADGDAVEPLPPKHPRRFREFVKKSLGDLLVTLLLLTCTVIYAASYHHYYFYTAYFASAITGLYFTNVFLQALCILLPYVKTCGPLSITVNYSRSARSDYQYQIRLPQDGVKKSGSGKQPITVSAA